MQLLIDGSFLAYRGASVNRDLATSKGVPTGLIYGFLRSIFSLRKRWPDATFFVAWDDNPRRKKEIYPDYKANRVKGEGFNTVIRPQRKVLRDILQTLGVDQGLNADEEADDVIGSMIDSNTSNLIVSADRDFLQLVEDDKVQLFCPKTGKNAEKIYTEKDVEDEYGVNPKEFVLWKVFRGDGSDNLPGVKRLPSDRVVKLAKYGSIAAAYRSPFPGFTANQHKAVKAFRKQAEINFDLMKIRTDLDVDVRHGSFDREAFQNSCEELEMYSLKKDVDLFEPAT